MESETLKPCPNVCCKSDPRMLHNKARAGYLVLCRVCGWSASELKERKAEAIAAWNKRPVDPVIEAAQKVADAARLFNSARNRSVIGAVDNRNSVVLAARALAALLPPNSANSPVIPEGSDREWRVAWGPKDYPCGLRKPDRESAFRTLRGPGAKGLETLRVQFSDDSGMTWQDAPETPNAQ